MLDFLFCTCSFLASFFDDVVRRVSHFKRLRIVRLSGLFCAEVSEKKERENVSSEYRQTIVSACVCRKPGASLMGPSSACPLSSGSYFTGGRAH